jgi:hypothetical protein
MRMRTQPGRTSVPLRRSGPTLQLRKRPMSYCSRTRAREGRRPPRLAESDHPPYGAAGARSDLRLDRYVELPVAERVAQLLERDQAGALPGGGRRRLLRNNTVPAIDQAHVHFLHPLRDQVREPDFPSRVFGSSYMPASIDPA